MINNQNSFYKNFMCVNRSTWYTCNILENVGLTESYILHVLKQIVYKAFCNKLQRIVFVCISESDAISSILIYAELLNRIDSLSNSSAIHLNIKQKYRPEL